MSWKVQRRHLMTGAGAVFLLPLLEKFFPKEAMAAGTSDPRRFVSLYMPNGTYNVQGDAVWYPANLATGPLTTSMFNQRSVFAPFTSELSNFSILMHPQCQARNSAASVVPDGGGHVSAVTTFLTQAVFTDVNSTQCTVPGSSFDQMVADKAGKPNLVLSGGCNDANPDGIAFNYADYVSFASGQPNEPHKNPVELYKAMFASIVSTPNAPVLAATRNHSILDSSLSDIKDLQSKLGKTDNQKLDDYMTSVRHLETQLFTPPVVASACTPGTQPPETIDNVDLDGSLSNVYDQRVQSFFDMIVLAFKCDLVRSVSFMYDGETAGRQNNPCPSNLLYDNADLTGQLHIGISHYGQNSNGDEKCISRDRNYLSLFFYLLDALGQATDPSGSAVLDNTIVMAGYNVTDGQHTGNAEGTPLVVGGGKNFMHPGNCFDLKHADLTSVLYTFNTFLGLGLTDFQGDSTLLSI
ncbi:MAG TPA: DUF1552 domain-containing protein [Polyangiaceae bacterium]